MKYRSTLTAASVLFLSACALPLPPQQPTIIPASLTVPCPPHLVRNLETWGDLVLDYRDSLAELADCRARHRALSEAVTVQQGTK